jgi:dinuclear metal center YbgI/SA1388 family protein
MFIFYVSEIPHEGETFKQFMNIKIILIPVELVTLDNDNNIPSMKISDICRFLEAKAPVAYQEDYDNAGLITGDPDMEFHRALLCLDVTPAVMEEAISQKCNLVISHHPFIFHGIKKLVQRTPETIILSSAIRNDIAIYAIHTNLDNIRDGLNAFILQKLRIKEYRILSPKRGLIEKLVTFCPKEHASAVRNALFAAGAGSIGDYDNCSFNSDGTGSFRASENANPFVGEKNVVHFEIEVRIEVVVPVYLEKKIVNALMSSHPYEEVAYDLFPLSNSVPRVGSGLVGQLPVAMQENDFFCLLRDTFNLPVIKHSPFRSKPVLKVALCTGSGSFLIGEALQNDADVFITSDLKYHDFFVPFDRLVLADIGHYESEHWVKEWLYAVLIEKFPNFAFLISGINTNPVKYF